MHVSAYADPVSVAYVKDGFKAGEEAGKAVTSRIPFCGLLNGAAKNRGNQLGAVAAVGGEELIRTTFGLSHANLDDYAVYMHLKHEGDAEYSNGLYTASTIHPTLEKS